MIWTGALAVELSETLGLAHEFAALAAELHGDGDNDAALRRMVDLAVEHVPACTWASITLFHHTTPRTIASSDPIASSADQLQYELGEGPCLQGATDGATYLLFNVAGESRWPNFAAALLERTSVRSVLSFELPAQRRAALNLFCDAPDAFDDDSVALGAVFAAHVSTGVALYEAESSTANLQVALESSRQIGAAMGVLMADHKVTQDDAFTLLRMASQRLHVKLREVAHEVVETGTLPDLPELKAADRPAIG